MPTKTVSMRRIREILRGPATAMWSLISRSIHLVRTRPHCFMSLRASITAAASGEPPRLFCIWFPA